jgi:hypothetical protein
MAFFSAGVFFTVRYRVGYRSNQSYRSGTVTDMGELVNWIDYCTGYWPITALEPVAVKKLCFWVGSMHEVVKHIVASVHATLYNRAGLA